MKYQCQILIKERAAIHSLILRHCPKGRKDVRLPGSSVISSNSHNFVDELARKQGEQVSVLKRVPEVPLQRLRGGARGRLDEARIHMDLEQDGRSQDKKIELTVSLRLKADLWACQCDWNPTKSNVSKSDKHRWKICVGFISRIRLGKSPQKAFGKGRPFQNKL